jgi:hypothetical protein
MEDNLQQGDRLIVVNNDYNPLTEFYLEKIDGNSCYVNLSYGIIGGSNVIFPISKVSKHPIQKSEFTFCVEISGNECNSQNPKINDYVKYLLEMNNSNHIYRAANFCFDRLLKSFSVNQSKIDASDELIYILNSSNVLDNLNNFIVSIISSLPKDFESKSILEYQANFVPVIAIYNSDKINNNIVTAICLILYTTLMCQLGVLNKESIIKELNLSNR